MVTTHSMVAMAGEIMPAPLAQAPRRTTPWGNCTSRAHSLAKRSVVMMAELKAAPASAVTAAAALAVASAMNDASSCTPMMPVEATAARSTGMPMVWAHACCIARATSKPFCPVQALALPLLMATARSPPGTVSSRVTTTGAAAKALVVDTCPEEAVPRHSGATATTPMSGRPLCFSPTTMPLARKPSGKVTPGDLPSGSTRCTPSGNEKKRVSRGETTIGCSLVVSTVTPSA